MKLMKFSMSDHIMFIGFQHVAKIIKAIYIYIYILYLDFHIHSRSNNKALVAKYKMWICSYFFCISDFVFDSYFFVFEFLL